MLNHISKHFFAHSNKNLNFKAYGDPNVRTYVAQACVHSHGEKFGRGLSPVNGDFLSTYFSRQQNTIITKYNTPATRRSPRKSSHSTGRVEPRQEVTNSPKLAVARRHCSGAMVKRFQC